MSEPLEVRLIVKPIGGVQCALSAYDPKTNREIGLGVKTDRAGLPSAVARMKQQFEAKGFRVTVKEM